MADGSRSSSLQVPRATSFPLWLRRAMPSLADLIFLALLGALVFTPLSVKLLNDAGIGWHIRNGQHILATHTIPRFDSFSFILWQPWFAWEWLYDIAVGKLEAWCGLNGVVWLTAVVIATVFAGTFRLAVARGTNLLLALLLTLLAISASMIQFLARPHVLSWLFVLAWFWILDSTDPYGWKLHAHIYGYLSNRFLMDHIDEFQSPNFHGIAQKCFLALLLIAIAALAAGGRKLRLSEILLLLFAVYAGLYASRNIPVSSVLLVLLVGPLRPSLKSWGFAQRMSVVDSRLRG